MGATTEGLPTLGEVAYVSRRLAETRADIERLAARRAKHPSGTLPPNLLRLAEETREEFDAIDAWLAEQPQRLAECAAA